MRRHLLFAFAALASFIVLGAAAPAPVSKATDDSLIGPPSSRFT
jgi:hypothetical protein